MIELSRDPRYVNWSISSPIHLKYNVKLTRNCFDNSQDLIAKYGIDDETSIRLLLVDDGVPNHFITAATDYLKAFEQDVKVVQFLTIENTKDLDLLLRILAEFEKFGVPRRGNPILALGGGVLLDSVGFAASVYRRGVPYLKIPTTLLSIVDTAVGIKTSINHFTRRNRLGSFYPPIAASLSPLFLDTLPKEQMSYGLAEIIKIAIIKSDQLFVLLERNKNKLLDATFYNTSDGLLVIELACHHMLEELAPNLTETNLERLVDFGHTFSPIPEMLSLSDPDVDELAHGEAVFLDIIFTCCIGQVLGRTTEDFTQRIVALGLKASLPINHPYFTDPLLLLQSSNDAKKHRAGQVNLPVPQAVSDVWFLRDIDLDLIEKAIAVMQEIVNRND